MLFTICVLVWSTTWYAITFQLGGSTPELGVALRFLLAGVCVLGWRAVRGETLYRPDVLAGAGVLLAVAGNVLILRRPAATVRGVSRATE